MRPSILIFLFFVVPQLNGQELIANGGFEDYNICTEYNAPCAPEAWFRLPPTEINVKLKKVPRVYEGKYAELVVIENEKNPLIYRVFLYTQLLCPLVQGQEYIISFYINPVFKKRYNIDLLLTEQELVSDLVNPLAFKATRILTEKDETWKNKKTNWRRLEISFTARGGEQYLTFGNFSTEATLLYGKSKANNQQGDLVFLLDNISVQAKSPLTAACPEMEETRRLLYATNHRHTYKRGIKKKRKVVEEVVIAPPTLPIEIKDTVEAILPPPPTFEVPGVAFDFDLHQLKPEYFAALDSLVMTIRHNAWRELQVLGHTDDVGEESYNLELSTKRALAVKQYLEERLPSQKISIQAEGRGECCPKVANTSAENRARNRRVEIIPKSN